MRFRLKRIEYLLKSTFVIFPMRVLTVTVSLNKLKLKSCVLFTGSQNIFRVK